MCPESIEDDDGEKIPFSYEKKYKKDWTIY